MSGNLLWVPVAMYAAGWLAAFGTHWSQPPRSAPMVGTILAIGLAIHSVLLVMTLANTGMRVGSLLSIAAWASIVAYFGASRSARLRALNLVVLPLAIALLLSSILVTEETLVRAPDVHNEWVWRNLLTAHIVALLAGHLLFALACLSSVAFLLQERQLKKRSTLLSNRLPSLGTLETVTHRSVGLGFLCLTIGILLGLAVAGAENLRARLWDPRLAIPVTSWVVYAGFLLVYTYRGRRGRFSALWSIAGFSVVLVSLVFEMAVLTLGKH
jgi:ABC-type uncharacterized transport system permease subunit